jgi:hypothetical protein
MPSHDDTIDRYSFKLVERLIENVTFEYVLFKNMNIFFYTYFSNLTYKEYKKKYLNIEIVVIK